eukprot:TRINITY_DN122042_c0_g1_i1.p1 TRINITY_DN122042_c0_g1~~TRINITY_DN122042_c0_g1_i1.p1  ORF type:complete len:703 (-),score=196.60 TRINITY_DN122042_c0_g1_i1:127-2235(-)
MVTPVSPQPLFMRPAALASGYAVPGQPPVRPADPITHQPPSAVTSAATGSGASGTSTADAIPGCLAKGLGSVIAVSMVSERYRRRCRRRTSSLVVRRADVSVMGGADVLTEEPPVSSSSRSLPAVAPEAADTEDGVDELRNQRPLWPGVSDELVPWGGMVIPASLQAAFKNRGIVEPSGIQQKAMGPLTRGDHVILHAPTGSGKTLSFLVPLLARLQPTLHVGIQMLVLVPTPELALQTVRELRWLVNAICGLDRMAWFNPQVPRELCCDVLQSRRAVWEALTQDTGILVTTPGILRAEMNELKEASRKDRETFAYFLGSNLDAIVLDEADALFPALPAFKSKRHLRYGQAERVCQFLFDVVRHRYRNRPVQMVCAAATGNAPKVRQALKRLQEWKYPKKRDFPRHVKPKIIADSLIPTMHASVSQAKDLEDLDDATERSRIQNVQLPGGITHALCHMNEFDDRYFTIRMKLAADIVKRLQGHVLIFVPDKIKADSMVYMLHEAGVTEATKYRADVGLSQSAEDLMNPELDDTRQTHSRESRFPMKTDKKALDQALQGLDAIADSLKEGQRRVFVAKSSSVRGLDLEGIKYVLLLKMPERAVQYMHIAGRTGRMGKTGTVITLLSEDEGDAAALSVETTLNIKFNGWDREAGAPVSAEEEETKLTEHLSEEERSQEITRLNKAAASMKALNDLWDDLDDDDE